MRSSVINFPRNAKMEIDMKIQFMFVILLFSSIPLPVFSAEATGVISVQINELKNNSGYVAVSLFNNADAFPTNPEKAYRKLRSQIQNNVALVRFVDVPHGEYAVAVYHDENANGKLDTNFIGIPNEGLGSSNDAKGSFGPPKFADAKFTLKEDRKTLVIKVSY